MRQIVVSKTSYVNQKENRVYNYERYIKAGGVREDA
jgi:hypothetical protein